MLLFLAIRSATSIFSCPAHGLRRGENICSRVTSIASDRKNERDKNRLPNYIPSKE